MDYEEEEDGDDDDEEEEIPLGFSLFHPHSE